MTTIAVTFTDTPPQEQFDTAKLLPDNLTDIRPCLRLNPDGAYIDCDLGVEYPQNKHRAAFFAHHGHLIQSLRLTCDAGREIHLRNFLNYAPANFPCLRELIVKGMVQSDELLANLLGRCSGGGGLEVLDLVSADAFGDSRKCFKFGPKSAAALRKHGPSMRSLRVMAPQISNRDIQGFIVSASDLQVLDIFPLLAPRKGDLMSNHAWLPPDSFSNQ
ncbi:hypothetical protein BGW39_002256 [Mortierella sp. 14UC]|nr:hypothetical protein BGW39_002256 [Mortierella sp. 14UC]